MCVEQGQHNPRKDYPWHPLCHGFIRYTDDYFSVESCRSSSSSLPTNRIPGLALGVILMISPSASTFPPSVIVYALQVSLADTRKSPCLSFPSSYHVRMIRFLAFLLVGVLERRGPAALPLLQPVREPAR